MTVFRVRLRRSALDRVFGGVCGGIGACLGVSGWWIRGAFAALALTSFLFAALLYVLLWVSIPGQRIPDLPPLIRPGEPEVPRYPRPEAILIVGGLAILIGIVVLAEQTGVFFASRELIPPVMLLIIGLIVLLKHLRGVA